MHFQLYGQHQDQLLEDHLGHCILSILSSLHPILYSESKNKIHLQKCNLSSFHLGVKKDNKKTIFKGKLLGLQQVNFVFEFNNGSLRYWMEANNCFREIFCCNAEETANYTVELYSYIQLCYVPLIYISVYPVRFIQPCHTAQLIC